MRIANKLGRGCVLSSQAVAMFQQLARDHGAVTRDQTPVLDIVPSANDDNVSVVTTAGTVHCNKCVVTVGAWASKMLYKVGSYLGRSQKTYFRHASHPPARTALPY
jgi:glycine/D-amino acid oxidase-like deaminating enzyme